MLWGLWSCLACVQGAGLYNLLWGLWACLTWALGFVGLSHMCTGGRTAEQVLGFVGLSHMGSGVCGLVSHVYRGQDCTTCSGVCGSVSHGLWALWAYLTWALGFVGLSHMGSEVCGPVSRGQSTVCDRSRRYRWARSWQWQFCSGEMVICGSAAGVVSGGQIMDL